MLDMHKLFKNWDQPLSELGRGPNLLRALTALNTLHSKGIKFYPERKNVFRAFRMVDPEDTRVIIIGMDPYHDGTHHTGYAFANPVNTIRISPSLKKVIDCISGDDLYLDFDITLQHWAIQGVLAINSAFTVERGRPGSHINIWRDFTAELLHTISKNFDNLIFCFWGSQAQSFSYLVDGSKHTVLTSYHPAHAVYRKAKWECDHFKKINSILKEPIKW